MTVNELNKKALEILGDRAMIIAMEELAELQQAISKTLRDQMNYDNLCEEMADVLIIMDWIKEKYNISQHDINYWKMNKQSRIHNRIETGMLK